MLDAGLEVLLKAFDRPKSPKSAARIAVVRFSEDKVDSIGYPRSQIRRPA